MSLCHGNQAVSANRNALFTSAISESRAGLLKEYWLLLRNREDTGGPLLLENTKDDEQLFLRRYALPTSIDELHPLEVAPFSAAPVAPPPTEPVYAQLVTAQADAVPQEDAMESVEEYARPKDVHAPSVEELGWRAKRSRSNKKKKNKEKDKDPLSGDKGNWQPMDFARWIATIKANPTHTILSRIPPKPITTPPLTKAPPPNTIAQVMQRKLFMDHNDFGLECSH